MREIQNTNPWPLYSEGAFLILPCGTKVQREAKRVWIKPTWQRELDLRDLRVTEELAEIFNAHGPRSWVFPASRLGFIPIRLTATEAPLLDLVSEGVFLMREQILSLGISVPRFLIGWTGPTWPHSLSLIDNFLGDLVDVIHEPSTETALQRNRREHGSRKGRGERGNWARPARAKETSYE